MKESHKVHHNRLLLANLYFRQFILGWKKLGLMERYKAHIVNFADDFIKVLRAAIAFHQ